MNYYVKYNAVRHAAIKISPLEFRGSSKRSGAVLITRLLFYYRSNRSKYRFERCAFIQRTLHIRKSPNRGSPTISCWRIKVMFDGSLLKINNLTFERVKIKCEIQSRCTDINQIAQYCSVKSNYTFANNKRPTLRWRIDGWNMQWRR